MHVEKRDRIARFQSDETHRIDPSITKIGVIRKTMGISVGFSNPSTKSIEVVTEPICRSRVRFASWIGLHGLLEWMLNRRDLTEREASVRNGRSND